MAELRNYQKEIVSEIFKKWKYKRAIILQMPTGTGKTVVFAQIIHRQRTIVSPKKRILVLVHRKELIEQIIKELKEKVGIAAGKIVSGTEYNPRMQVQVASVQTLVRRNIMNRPRNISLIIVDEAHHIKAKTYLKILDFYKNENAKLLGVTATPIRTDGAGFKDVFDEIVCSYNIKKFIKLGHLARIKHLATSIPNISNIKINDRTKDYDVEEATQAMIDNKVMADLIESYNKYGTNKQAIVFAVSREHSRKITERYKNEGINAEYIDSETNKAEREKTVKEFREGKIKVLCNVNIFTEGFDCPEVEVVQLARPTKSRILFYQQIGRVMRPKNGGGYGTILDNACLWKEHGLVTKEVIWTLDGIKESGHTKVIAKSNKHDNEKEINEPIEMLGLELEEIEISESNESEIENIYDKVKITIARGQNFIQEEIEYIRNNQKTAGIINKKSLEQIAEIIYSNLYAEPERIIFRNRDIVIYNILVQEYLYSELENSCEIQIFDEINDKEVNNLLKEYLRSYSN